MKNNNPPSRSLVGPLLFWKRGLAFALATAYTAAAAVHNARGATFIFVVYGLTALTTVTSDHRVRQAIVSAVRGLVLMWKRIPRLLRASVVPGAVAAVLLERVVADPRRLVSLVGLVVLLVLCYAASWNRRKIAWRPIYWGMVLQFVLALGILRTKAGYEAFDFIGRQIKVLLQYTDHGATFVFGALTTGLTIPDQAQPVTIFAFKVLPTIVFFSSLVSVLYYLGVMQATIRVLAVGMKHTMGTSAPESLNAAGNIFVGLTEAPLLIRPFLSTMTRSELHAVMTGGFATIAGAVMAIYISFGVDPCHLLTASVMSAPAALAISKLIYPEDETPEEPYRRDDEEAQPEAEDRMASEAEKDPKATQDLMKSNCTNLIEAAAEGASIAVGFVGNIVGMLITFLSLIAMADAWVEYLGERIGLTGWSLTKITGWIFYPVAALLGVPFEDCQIVGELLGVKIVVNEFVAYMKLMEYHEAGKLSPRSMLISTFALCGFSNFGSIGITIGGLLPLAPTRGRDFAELVLSAMIAGNVVCLVTACIAALLSDV